MADRIVLTLTEKDSGEKIVLEKCLSMRFEKERYTPYTTFGGTFLASSDFGDVSDVLLTINGTDVHRGPADTVRISHSSSGHRVTVNSRGYTSAFGQNEIRPGILSDLSLVKLLTDEAQIPNTYFEENSEEVNYLYVVAHTSVWDAASNLCLKLAGTYPYIAHVNTLRYTTPEETTLITPEADGTLIEYGTETDYRNILSDIYMSDTEGTPDAFSFINEESTALGIKRERYLSLDKRWLNNEQLGLTYRSHFSMRGYNRSYVAYRGYCGEDINDRVSFGENTEKRISRILVTGGKNGVSTRLWCYKDKFCNVE